MLVSVAAAWWLTPSDSTAEVPRLSDAVPKAFGDWKEIPTRTAVVDPRRDQDEPRNFDNPYDDVLMRAYGNSKGDVILVALAYGRHQRQEVKIHRPELCYVAQGFDIIKRASTTFPISNAGGAPVTGARMLVQAPGRVEAVSYWMRIGGVYTESAWTIRYYILKEGLNGRVLDGILVRVSQIIADPASASDERYLLQERFMADLVSAMPIKTRHLLINGYSA
jgi:EpsI family protein